MYQSGGWCWMTNGNWMCQWWPKSRVHLWQIGGGKRMEWWVTGLFNSTATFIATPHLSPSTHDLLNSTLTVIVTSHFSPTTQHSGIFSNYLQQFTINVP